jgi:hypothetical protein
VLFGIVEYSGEFVSWASEALDNSFYSDIARIEKQDLLTLYDFGIPNPDKTQRDLLM